MTNCPSGCGRSARPGHLMCGPCWAEVPRHLQNEVMRTWRAYGRAHKARTGLGTPEQNDAIRKARVAYQEARDAALGSIR